VGEAPEDLGGHRSAEVRVQLGEPSVHHRASLARY
jgi:hypothetical protein